MTATARKKSRRPAGRPIDPDSLRQAGTVLRIRILRDDRARYEALATRQGTDLSPLVRRLLAKWHADAVARRRIKPPPATAYSPRRRNRSPAT